MRLDVGALLNDVDGDLRVQRLERFAVGLDVGEQVARDARVGRAEVTRYPPLGEERDALELPAEELPSAEDIWLAYRASVAHGLAIWMATLSGGDAWQRADICLAFAQRYAAAFVDLETSDALDTLCG